MGGLEGDAAFGRLHQRGVELYGEDAGFRDACREASGWVLEGRLAPGRVPDEHQVECAVRYLLAELPLFVDSPAIIGATSSVFCYHRPPSLLRRLYGRELSLVPAPGQGFAVVEAVEQSVVVQEGEGGVSGLLHPSRGGATVERGAEAIRGHGGPGLAGRRK